MLLVLHPGGKLNGGEGRMNGYMYLRSCDLIHILHLVV
jgi:hypothetical protein